jgi:hypothetical protein
MQRRNIVGVNTRYGYRTCELHEGDISQLDRHVDAMAISALAGDYQDPPSGTIKTSSPDWI